jgi:hypothetical protein
MPIDLKSLARAGAETRIKELLAELEKLRRAFLGIGGGQRGRPRAQAVNAETVKQPKRGRRKPMTAAEKKAVSERMKRYWTARRKEKTR